MNFSSAMSSLYAELGSSKESQDTSFPLSLVIDDRWELTVDLDSQRQEIVVSVPVPSVPMDMLNRPEAARKLLSFSLLGAQTGGCALSFSEDTQCLVVWLRHPDEFPGEEAANQLLERVVSTAAFMDAWCQNNLDASSKPSSQAEPAHQEDTTGWFKI